MKGLECAREQDLLDALTSRRWPERAEEDLRAHVARCAICADLARVASALLDAEEVADPVPDLPPAGLVWWRAQLRAREEATRAALRPIKAVQLAACAVAAVLIVLALGATWPGLTAFAARAVSRAVSSIARIDPQATADLALSTLANRGVQFAAGAWLILAPVAAYLALSRD
jgi:hypothetical protein